MWLAYCAMAAALVPLVLMGVGYFFLGSSRRSGGTAENRGSPSATRVPEASE